jgi:hypothetical protein
MPQSEKKAMGAVEDLDINIVDSTFRFLKSTLLVVVSIITPVSTISISLINPAK